MDGKRPERTAFHAVQSARPYAVDKPIWRYLQTSDHFYYMASKFGTCGEVHTYFSHHEAEDAFKTYMRVLADYEARNMRVMKNRKSAKTLRTLPPELAFHFAGPTGFIGHSAYNLDQFEEQLYVVPKDSITFHQERGDFFQWINDVLEDPRLAESIKRVDGTPRTDRGHKRAERTAMESCKVAFFCWESLYAERVGGLANAATNLAETLVKQNHEVHYFTRGSIPDQTINGVQYHYCRPFGQNIVEYRNDMSKAMVSQFRTHDSPGRFDFLHFHDWHPVQALHYLQDRNTLLTYHSTEYGRNGNQFGDWWEFREISGKEWDGGLIAKRVTAVSATLRNEVMTLYNVPEEKCEVIPNGIVPRAYRASIDPGEVKASYGIHPYAPLILFIGRRVPERARPAHRSDPESLPAPGGCKSHRRRDR